MLQISRVQHRRGAFIGGYVRERYQVGEVGVTTLVLCQHRDYLMRTGTLIARAELVAIVFAVVAIIVPLEVQCHADDWLDAELRRRVCELYRACQVVPIGEC